MKDGHIAGLMSRYSKCKIERLAAIDPAGPEFNPNDNDCLQKDDAEHTTAFHTNHGLLGFRESITDLSIYFNGDTRLPLIKYGVGSQPGCHDYSCSHARAYEF